MEEIWHVKVDQQIMRLLNINVWSNLFCILLLFAINLIQFLRGSSSTTAPAIENGASLLSPELLLFLSVACSIWLVLRAMKAKRICRRMENVFLSIEGDMIEGISLAKPSASSREYPNGRPFRLNVHTIKDVVLQEVSILQKQSAHALAIKTDGDTLIIPGIEQAKEIVAHLSQFSQSSVVAK